MKRLLLTTALAAALIAPAAGQPPPAQETESVNIRLSEVSVQRTDQAFDGATPGDSDIADVEILTDHAFISGARMRAAPISC